MFIGAEHIISPLAKGAAENFEEIFKGNSGVSLQKGIGINNEDLYVAKFKEDTALSSLMLESVQSSLENYNWKNDSKSLLIVSTTKGEIDYLSKELVEEAKLSQLANGISKDLGFNGDCITLSNACISGVLGIIQANDFIQCGLYDEVIVVGGDLASLFTISGFQSFFAISDEPCKPYDKNRKGINLGDGVASVILSKDKERFKQEPIKVLGGASANDANHISGPSRTGEGLFRAIKNSMTEANVNASDIGFISSHGTATSFNDEMESIAFQRADLLSIPTNSLKGYFGHTLGAAGLLETAITLQGLRKQKIVASAGFEEFGVSHQMNIIQQAKEHHHQIAMKTASGFGGCNASVIFKLED